MDNLFEKAVSLTDLHFGRNSNAPQANLDNIEFIEWFIEKAKTWGAKVCFVLGDYYDNRRFLGLHSIEYGTRGMEMLSQGFERVYWIPGNHDLMFRDKRDISSVGFSRYFPNVTYVTEPLHLGNVTILPWLVGDEKQMLKSLTSRYVFGHLELNGWMMNEKVPMPDHEGGITAEDFPNPEFVFSGHFHYRQAAKNIVYTGNIMPLTFGDAGDRDRGMMLLEWGKDPYFEAWPDQPTFELFKLSEIMDKPSLLRPKMSIRVDIDTDLSFEQKKYLREEFLKVHQLRKIDLIERKADKKAHATEVKAAFRTIDQIFYEGIDEFDGDGFDRNLLKTIYRDVAEKRGKV